MLTIFTNIFNNQNQNGDLRIRVSKILVTLTFDDVLDEYKFRIVKLLGLIKDKPIPLLHYDLIGIFEGIEAHTISKYFYNRLKKEFNLKQFVTSLAQITRNIHQ